MKAVNLSGAVSAAALATALISSHAYAQGVFDDTIVVTAQKRNQDMQDVGIAITAYSGDQLRELGFSASTDLIVQTPGLEA
ncbi:MAG: hypothetical protein KDA48_03995, partial [Amphiplicatus sp.]|nr:hypothetical protein [Amphiplicatus sp.]